VLTPQQITAIQNLSGTYSATNIPSDISSISLPSEQAAEDLLIRAIEKRLYIGTQLGAGTITNPENGTFLHRMQSLGINMPDSREKAVLMSMWYQGGNNYFGLYPNLAMS
jgi:hypothetical protein